MAIALINDGMEPYEVINLIRNNNLQVKYIIKQKKNNYVYVVYNKFIYLNKK